MTESRYPEHAKLHTVKDQSQIIGEFLEAMPFELCEWNDTAHAYVPTGLSIETILANHFGINLKKVQEEKQQMLDNIRFGNARERELND